MTRLGLSVPREMSLREQVTDSLREAILSGGLHPGQKLVERELCEELRISRTILREALQHLHAEGLIVNLPRKGRSVAAMGEEEAREIQEVRKALEPLVAQGFARNASDAQVARLRAHLERMAQPDGANDIVRAESEFFSIMLDGCGNRLAGDMLTQLNNRIAMLRRLSLGRRAGQGATLRELGAIMAAIEARDPARAGKLCADRIATVADVEKYPAPISMEVQ